MKNLLILPIRIYQIVISPILGAGKCRYYPTCSNYAIEAIKKRGLIRGFVMLISRILRCHPWGKGGFDPVK